MPLITVRQFAPLMRQRVALARMSGIDSYGNRTYGSDVTYQCALVGEMKMVADKNGQEVLSRQAAYLMSNAAFTPSDRITLSTQDVGSTEAFALQPPILAVGRYPFTSGQFCTVVYLSDGVVD